MAGALRPDCLGRKSRRNDLIAPLQQGVKTPWTSDCRTSTRYALTEHLVSAPVNWDREGDVVVSGAGATGLPAAIVAREAGCSVILVEAESDIGGHAIISGGNVPLGGGTSVQKHIRDRGFTGPTVPRSDRPVGDRPQRLSQLSQRRPQDHPRPCRQQRALLRVYPSYFVGAGGEPTLDLGQRTGDDLYVHDRHDEAGAHRQHADPVTEVRLLRWPYCWRRRCHRALRCIGGQSPAHQAHSLQPGN